MGNGVTSLSYGDESPRRPRPSLSEFASPYLVPLDSIHPLPQTIQPSQRRQAREHAVRREPAARREHAGRRERDNLQEQRITNRAQSPTTQILQFDAPSARERDNFQGSVRVQSRLPYIMQSRQQNMAAKGDGQQRGRNRQRYPNGQFENQNENENQVMGPSSFERSTQLIQGNVNSDITRVTVRAPQREILATVTRTPRFGRRAAAIPDIRIQVQSQDSIPEQSNRNNNTFEKGSEETSRIVLPPIVDAQSSRNKSPAIQSSADSSPEGPFTFRRYKTIPPIMVTRH